MGEALTDALSDWRRFRRFCGAVPALLVCNCRGYAIHLQAQNIGNGNSKHETWPDGIRDGNASVTLGLHAKVGFIDARDIADVAVHQLLAERVGNAPLVLTGSEALTVRDIAAIASRIVGTPIVAAEAAAGAPALPPGFEQRAVREFMVLIREGRAAALTDTVQRLLGRAPRTVQAFLEEYLQQVPA